MDHSLEGLAKNRGARYLKFEFAEVKRPPSDPNSQAMPSHPGTPPRGFREEPRVWVEPETPDAGKSSATVSSIPATVSPRELVTPKIFGGPKQQERFSIKSINGS